MQCVREGPNRGCRRHPASARQFPDAPALQRIRRRRRRLRTSCRRKPESADRQYCDATSRRCPSNENGTAGSRLTYLAVSASLLRGTMRGHGRSTIHPPVGLRPAAYPVRCNRRSVLRLGMGAARDAGRDDRPGHPVDAASDRGQRRCSGAPCRHDGRPRLAHGAALKRELIVYCKANPTQKIIEGVAVVFKDERTFGIEMK